VPEKPKSRPRSTRPGRLTGNALEKLRRACFERDGYMCQHGLDTFWQDGKRVVRKCLRPVAWDSGFPESGHMAHIRARSIGGKDELSNVVTKCADCHLRREHTMGEK